jgi:transcriptional regulator with XRE-family HTH domain
MKLEMLIARAKFYEKTQKAIAKKLAISETKFSDWKKGKTKPTPFEIFQMAELARLEPEKTFYDVMTEIDKENEKYWCARLESNQRPSASEVVSLQLLFTFIYNVIQNLKIKRVLFTEVNV